MTGIYNTYNVGEVPTNEQLEALLGEDFEPFDSLAPLRRSLPSVPSTPVPGFSREPHPLTTTIQSTSAAMTTRSPFTPPAQPTSQMPAITPAPSTPSSDGFQSALFKALMPQQPEQSPVPSTPSSFEFQSPMLKGLAQQQTSPHLAFRSEGKESAVRPATPRMIMCGIDDRIAYKMPKRQILSEPEYNQICSLFNAGEKTFKPRSGLEHPLHQEINKHVTTLVLLPKILKLDEQSKAACEQLIAEICQASIMPIPQELVEVAVRYHMFKAFVNNLSSCNEQQKTILFSIATGNGLFSLPQLDPSERPLTVLGQVIATSDKIITKGLNSVAAGAQNTKSAISQLVKQTSSSLKETFSLQRQPIDFSSVKLPPSAPSPTVETPSLASSAPPSMMPTPEPVQEALYPSLFGIAPKDTVGSHLIDNTPSEWEPDAQSSSIPLTAPAWKRLFSALDAPSSTVTARIAVKYQGNEGDKLYIRGTGPSMRHWGEAIEMRKEGNLWIYDSTEPFDNFEFKMMLNNQLWEGGDNHKISTGHLFEIPTIWFHDFH
ncbi:MAG: hypothetical protein JSR39_02375 [Verrucomicrobia bacterium]|nr:hypothetical protein [Verrucomicrobiota bacterium]